MKNVNLKELFENHQEQMLSTLKTNQKINHPGEKGNATEDNWIEWMKAYFPKRYEIDKAKIIDSSGNTSDQIDVVIYDRQYSPLVFNQNSVKYIPAESVYAVFEVKQTLNKKYLDYAANKAESVRVLKRTSAKIKHAGGEYEGRKPFSIISGILTTRCDWVGGISGETPQKHILSYQNDKKIDIGCSLNAGTFVRDGDNIRISTQDESLIFFFVQLQAMLSMKGTVCAIDILAYAEALDSNNRGS